MEKETERNIKTISKDAPDLIPVTEWNKYFAYPKLGALRQLIFYQNTNGFNKVLRRLGNTNRIYIKTSAFFEWVEETNQQNII